MPTFASHILQFSRELNFTGSLPRGIKIMNPFRENPEILPIAEKFYTKFYDDTNPRKIILGINPGRLGAGATGIPFTDTKRLAEICGIKATSLSTHEPSSVFVYKLIEQYGGVEKFYSDYYIHSICPLGFVEQNDKAHWINRNYYDYPDLFAAVKDFILYNLETQIAFGIDTRTCFVLGKKNAEYLQKINREKKFFGEIVVFDHPRFIEQYRARQRDKYIAEYLQALSR